MSNAPAQAISVNEAIAKLAELRRYIEAIQTQIDQVTAEIEEVKASTNTLSELRKEHVNELFMPTDSRGHIMIKVTPVTKERVLTHLGMEYFAELDLEKAMEVLLMKEKELKDVIRKLQEELDRVVIMYKQLQSAVNAAMAQAQAKAQKAG